MKKIINFVKESVEELRSQVDWPKYSELQNSSVLVLVASLIFALVIGLVDFLFREGVGIIYSTFN